MRSIPLVGVNAIGEKQRTNATVAKFTNDTDYFGITVHNNNLKMVTPEGVYYLKKHVAKNGGKNQNYFHGTCKGRRVEVTVRKVSGEVRYW
jgi:hypothetical protein